MYWLIGFLALALVVVALIVLALKATNSIVESDEPPDLR